MSTIVTRAGKGSALTHNEVDANFTNLNTDKVEKSGTDPVVISVNSSSDALRITQVGTGNALLVEDSTNPDATPFVIDASGLVIIGNNSSIAGSGSRTPWLQVLGASNSTSSQSLNAFSATGTVSSVIQFNKSANATIGSHSLVGTGATLGRVDFSGSDGTGFIEAASIGAFVNGTPTIIGGGPAIDMPGRLVFSTTAVGATSPTERMRIDSAGNVAIGTNSGEAKLVVLSGTQFDPLSARTTTNMLARGTGTAGSGAYGGAITFAQINSSRPWGAIAGVQTTADADQGGLAFFVHSSSVTSDALVEAMKIDNAGTLTLASGSGLSISATAVTSPAAADGNVFSGTYTPTLTNTTNVAASTAYVTQYMRVGNVVTVSGGVSVDPTTTGSTVLGISLPIASNFTTTEQASGTSVDNTLLQFARLYADTTNDRLTFQFNATDTANRTWSFTFTYRIV